MTRRFFAVILLLVSGWVFVGGAAPASAANLEAVGWWARTATTNPAAEVPVPVPAPTVPVTAPSGIGVAPGQLLVQGTPEGATAIAALKWTLASSESSPSLMLTAATGSALTVDSVVLACKAATTWTPPASRPGTWESKPITDGSSCINGVVAADGSSVGFGLQPLMRKNVLDVVLVAGTDLRFPEDANGSTFRFVFDQPAANALKVVKTAAPPSNDGAGSATPSAEEDEIFAFGPALAPSLSDLRSGDSSGAAAPALAPQDLGPSVPRLNATVSSETEDATPRTLAGLLLLGGAMLLMWLQRISDGDANEAVTVGLGRFRRTVEVHAVEPQMRGLAGFVRPRSKPPVRL